MNGGSVSRKVVSWRSLGTPTPQSLVPWHQSLSHGCPILPSWATEVDRLGKHAQLHWEARVAVLERKAETPLKHK